MSESGREPAGSAADGADARTLDSRRGKRAVVLAVWAVTTGFVATIGWVAGSNAGDAPVTLFGLVAVPDGPLALAAVAVLVGNLVFGAIALVVALASRVDADRTGGGRP